MRSILFATALGLLVLPVEAQEMETHIWRGEGEDMPMPGLCITRDMVSVVATVFGYKATDIMDTLMISRTGFHGHWVVTFDGLCATSAEIKG